MTLVFEEIKSTKSSITIKNWEKIAEQLKQALESTKTKMIAIPVKNFNEFVSEFASEKIARDRNAGYFQTRWAKELRQNLLSVGIKATEGSRKTNKLFFKLIK